MKLFASAHNDTFTIKKISTQRYHHRHHHLKYFLKARPLSTPGAVLCQLTLSYTTMMRPLTI